MNKVAITIMGGAKGRGLVASRRFRAGQVVLRETALVRSGDAGTSLAFPSLAAVAAEDNLVYPLMAAALANGVGDRSLAEAFDALCHVQLGPDTVPPTWLHLAALLEQDARTVKNDAQPSLQAPTLDQFVRAMGIVHLNTYTVDDQHCLFHVGSYVNHSCDPNTVLSLEARGHGVRLRTVGKWLACRPVDKGEEVTVSYVDTLLPVAARQEHLEFAYGFKCDCNRCVDEGG